MSKKIIPPLQYGSPAERTEKYIAAAKREFELRRNTEMWWGNMREAMRYDPVKTIKAAAEMLETLQAPSVNTGVLTDMFAWRMAAFLVYHVSRIADQNRELAVNTVTTAYPYLPHEGGVKTKADKFLAAARVA